MLGVDTLQPALVFDNTVFPALSLLDGGGRQLARLQRPARRPPRRRRLRRRGVGPARHGLLRPTVASRSSPTRASEDVLVVDASQRVRDGPGPAPAGSPAGRHRSPAATARCTSTSATRRTWPCCRSPPDPSAPRPKVDRSRSPPHAPRGRPHAPRSCVSASTSSTRPTATSCPIDARPLGRLHQLPHRGRGATRSRGGSRRAARHAVERRRDPPHRAFSSAPRRATKVQDYWRTIDPEQGGELLGPHRTRAVPALGATLEALADYVNYALPYPVPRAPSTRRRSRTAAAALSGSWGPQLPRGDRFTYSGTGNPDRSTSPVRPMLHDVGTCVTDRAVPDARRGRRAWRAPARQCAFDTPSLRGVSDRAPYLHDGSAATLSDVFARAPGMVGEGGHPPVPRRSRRARHVPEVPLKSIRSLVSLVVCGLAGLSACSSASSGAGGSCTQVPVFNSSFAGYESWTPFSFTGAAIPGSPHTSGPRRIYLSQKPAHGATQFPVGTIIREGDWRPSGLGRQRLRDGQGRLRLQLGRRGELGVVRAAGRCGQHRFDPLERLGAPRPGRPTRATPRPATTATREREQNDYVESSELLLSSF